MDGGKHVSQPHGDAVIVADHMTLADLLVLAHELPADERHVIETLNMVPYVPDRIAIAALNSIGWVFRRQGPCADGAPVAAGGFMQQSGGVYRTWFLAPEWAWQTHGAELTEECKRLISDLLARKLAHRIETVTLATQTRARTWYEKLGLTFESTLRGYGPQGEDAVMYVALAGEEKP